MIKKIIEGRIKEKDEIIGFFFGKEGLTNYFVIIGVLIVFFILMLISITQRY